MKETSRHRDAFEAWYDSGRNWSKTAQNTTVPRSSLYAWADRFDWHERADVRDREASRIADEDAARERAERQKRRRQAAELMTARGVEFFNGNKIYNASAAIQAIKSGLENERKEDGVPDWVLMILNADANEIERFTRDLSSASAIAAGEDEGDSSFALESDGEES